MVERKQDIVTVGGGSGSPVVNRSLIMAGAEYINAIAAVYDSGGATGIRRTLDTQGREIAYSDALRILLSLIDPTRTTESQSDVIKKLITDRNQKNQVLGHEIADRFFNEDEAFDPLVKDLETLGIHFLGRVLPSSTQSAHIEFRTKSGQKYRGEHMLDQYSMAKDMVIDMVLQPSVPAYIPARNAIENAQAIFISFGSLHGSILCNFLPERMREAMQNSKAKTFVITNLVSTRNESHEFSPADYSNLVSKYMGKKIDGIIVPDISRKKFESDYPDVALLYDNEHSHFLGWEQEELYQLQDQGIQVHFHRATKLVDVSGENRRLVRHDPEKLSEVLKLLV